MRLFQGKILICFPGTSFGKILFQNKSRTSHARNCSHVHLWFMQIFTHSLLYAIITSPLMFYTDFHSRAQGRARIRKGGVFRAQHGCDTLAWSEPSSYTGAVKQWRWRSFIYFFTNISHVIPHVIYVKTLKLSLGRVYAQGKI